MIRLAQSEASLRGRVHFAAVRALDKVACLLHSRAALYPAIALLGAAMGKRATVLMIASHEIAVEVPLADGYWVAAGLNGEYEPEMETFLARLDARPTLFLDCGANIGWWSLVGEKRRQWTCVAIEASAALVARIEAARAANRARFDIVHAAVWDADGEVLQFRTGRAAHAGGHLARVAGYVAGWRLPETETVASAAIDSIVAPYAQRATFERVIVKLDVEGAELQAIRGAKRTLAAGAMLLYEDHGRDRDSRTSQALFDMGMHVYSLDPLRRLSTAAEVSRQKMDRRRGYNFVAAYPGSDSDAEIAAL